MPPTPYVSHRPSASSPSHRPRRHHLSLPPAPPTRAHPPPTLPVSWRFTTPQPLPRAPATPFHSLWPHLSTRAQSLGATTTTVLLPPPPPPTLSHRLAVTDADTDADTRTSLHVVFGGFGGRSILGSCRMHAGGNNKIRVIRDGKVSTVSMVRSGFKPIPLPKKKERKKKEPPLYAPCAA